MNPPMVYDVTTPSSHNTSRITKIVQSIAPPEERDSRVVYGDGPNVSPRFAKGGDRGHPVRWTRRTRAPSFSLPLPRTNQMATMAPPPAPVDAPTFEPYVPASKSPAELTIRALVLGSALGVIFAASSVYLALKIGLTVSASIPIAV